MKLPALKFDTPNNAAQSLVILAELVRRSEIAVEQKEAQLDSTKRIDLAFYDMREAAKRHA